MLPDQIRGAAGPGSCRTDPWQRSVQRAARVWKRGERRATPRSPRPHKKLWLDQQLTCRLDSALLQAPAGQGPVEVTPGEVSVEKCRWENASDGDRPVEEKQVSGAYHAEPYSIVDNLLTIPPLPSQMTWRWASLHFLDVRAGCGRPEK
jgi:hypothetical protein